ncbi:hypothetical protein F5888DRAFT_554910 [Russula emetica]|nr:hypothetical protein F5888DRAFT_554910 [Russula emetica]
MRTLAGPDTFIAYTISQAKRRPPPPLFQYLRFFFSYSRTWAGRGTRRILRPGNAAADARLSTRSQGDAHAFTPSDSDAGKSTVVPLRRAYPSLPYLPPFASFFLRYFPPLIIFLPLVGIAGWDQSKHRHPRRARARGEELNDALPTRPYGLLKPFWTKPSIEAVRNVPDWFGFTPLDTVYAGRCGGGEATGTCVLQSLEDAGVAVSSNASASATTARFSAVGPGLTRLRSSWQTRPRHRYHA